MPGACTGRERSVDPEDGQLDLGCFLENPRGFLPMPFAHDASVAR
jgi:hypothetical protein